MQQPTESIPRSLRPHIGFFGRRNSGKSSLMNRLTGQHVSIVSDTAGTTTDTVYKNMELPGIGACVLVDTAGVDDEGELGGLRVEQTRQAAEKVDVAVWVTTPDAAQTDGSLLSEDGRRWTDFFRERQTPVVVVVNKCDTAETEAEEALPDMQGNMPVVAVSAREGKGMERLLRILTEVLQKRDELEDLTGSLAREGDLVVLVMPQDIQAPKGRLIAPQVQTLRNLLDKHCSVVCCTTDRLAGTLQRLSAPPRLLVTDSQAFATVESLCPEGTLLTSFSILFARSKGHLPLYLEGAEALTRIAPDAHILIAEACTHVPQNEDIGRVKLPRLLRARISPDLHIDIVSGPDFPTDLTPYSLVIHCGACMFTRRHVLSRLQRAASQHVPVTNYGIAIAALNGILPRVAFPE